MSRQERLPKSLHDAQQSDEGHWTAAPGNRTGNLPGWRLLFEGHCGQQRSRHREKEKRRAVNQRGRYDNDRRLTRIRGNRADQAAERPEQQEPVTVTGSVSIRHSDSAAGRPNPPIAHLRM